MAQPLWFAGICDSMLRKVEFWLRAWPSGNVYATRTHMSKTGEITDVPTMRDVRVAWHPNELKHLVRILKTVRPKWTVTADLEALLPKLEHCRLLAKGERLVPMCSYYNDPQEILELLRQVKAGKVGVEQELLESFQRDGSLFT